MFQERYHDWVLRMERELREDKMDVESLNAAVNYYAATHNVTVHQVQAMIQESPQSRQLVMNYYWESRTL